MFISWPRLALLFILAVGTLPAALITVEPTPQTASVGDMPTFDINISDLGNFSAPSISAYDFDVAFDSSVLAFNSVTPGPGTVNVFEISFDFPSDLDTLQPGAFTLFSVNFDAIGVGTSSIDVAVNSLGDSIGNPVIFDATSGSIAVSSVASVPEPSTVSLLLAGLAFAAVRVRRKR